MTEEAEVPQKKVLQKNKFRNGISRIKSMWRKSMLTKKLNENRMKMEKVKRKKWKENMKKKCFMLVKNSINSKIFSLFLEYNKIK